MTFETVTVSDADGVATVTLNRPEKLNALSNALKRELRQVAEALDQRDDLSCVLVTGAGRAFSAGADLDEREGFGDGASMAEARRLVRLGADMCAAWERLRPLTVAVINGPAIGGAMSLAVSCDFRVMGSNAWFQAPEVDLGINYSWNSLPRIGNLVGPARAKLIGALARKVDAETALAWGLCEMIADNPMAVVGELAAEICERPRIAQQMVKESVNRHFAMPNSLYLDQDQILLMARDSENRKHAEAKREKLVGKT